jgi:hypothetical protein
MNPILSEMAGWGITKEDKMKGIIQELKDLRTEDNIDKIDEICNTLEHLLDKSKEALDKGRTAIGYAFSRADLRTIYEVIGGDEYEDL